MVHVWNVLGAGLLAAVGSGAIAWALALSARRPDDSPDALHGTVFLFEGNRLADATPPARRLMRALGGQSDLDGLLALLGKKFGADLAARLAALPRGGRVSLASPDGSGVLDVADESGAVRLTLRPGESGGSAVDLLALGAMQEELDLLRGLAEGAPNPIWSRNASGLLVWANRAYLDLADRLGMCETPSEWPTAPLFREVLDGTGGRTERQAVAASEADEPLWFDVSGLPRPGGSLHFATDVTDLVQAETARLQFVQTLSRTFGDLDVGLAIFDRDRRLFLFNPAFGDLTRLPLDFLTERPVVQAVLDRMREFKTLPEPRDYVSWRESMASLEAAATQGTHRETWTLPDGRVYRVTGQPHFDGALALLIEDVSGEIGMVRRVRAELDLLREVLDATDEAVAVYADGALVQANAAYADLWGLPAAPRLSDEVRRWDVACEPSAFCEGLRGGQILGPARSVLGLRSGGAVAVRISALPRGATAFFFRSLPDQRAEGPWGHGQAPLAPAASPSL